MGYVEPPAGWFTFGSHLDYRGVLEFSDEFDEEGYPRFERPSAKDPFPYVGEYGSRHAYPGTLNQKPLSFEPRPEYDQDGGAYSAGCPVTAKTVERSVTYRYGPSGEYEGKFSGFYTWGQLEDLIKDDRWSSPYTITERKERTVIYGDWKTV